MASERQIAANRKNALLSTGPKSEEGKAVVGRNAVQHGILTKQVYTDDDTREEFSKFQTSFYLEFCPQSNLEAFLLERVITCAWWLNLVMKVEAEMFRGDAVWGVPKRIKGAFEGHAYNYMSVISRYENAIERSFYKALAEFKQAQEKRESTIEIGFVS